MNKILSILAVIVLASCGASLGGGSDSGEYLGYAESGPITNFQASAIQIRQVDLINAVRAENGLRPVRLNAQLTAAALTHARDISNQNRAWNFGSDKSTPQVRAERAGFPGIVVGEAVAETYNSEFSVFSLWYSFPISKEAILNPDATDVGIAYYMESSGKVWWVTDFAQMGASQTQ